MGRSDQGALAQSGSRSCRSWALPSRARPPLIGRIDAPAAFIGCLAFAAAQTHTHSLSRAPRPPPSTPRPSPVSSRQPAPAQRSSTSQACRRIRHLVPSVAVPDVALLPDATAPAYHAVVMRPGPANRGNGGSPIDALHVVSHARNHGPRLCDRLSKSVNHHARGLQTATPNDSPTGPQEPPQDNGRHSHAPHQHFTEFNLKVPFDLVGRYYQLCACLVFPVRRGLAIAGARQTW